MLFEAAKGNECRILLNILSRGTDIDWHDEVNRDCFIIAPSNVLCFSLGILL